MSMVTELRAAYDAAERNVDKQISALRSYERANDDLMKQITDALEGSTQTFSMNMTRQLSQTKQQIQSTIQLLDGAKRNLDKAKML